MAKELKATEVVTPKFRVSFPEVFEAKSFQDQPAKFSIQMLFDKKTDLAAIKKAMAAAVKEHYGDNAPPKGLTSPLKDGDEKDLDGYAGTLVVSASSKFKPDVVDQKGEPILAQTDFYAGCYARAFITAYVYEVKDPKNPKTILKKGIGFYLGHVQKLADGEPFTKRTKSDDVFDAVEDASSDAANYASDDMDFLN